jgi:hypothetical protein
MGGGREDARARVWEVSAGFFVTGWNARGTAASRGVDRFVQHPVADSPVGDFLADFRLRIGLGVFL